MNELAKLLIPYCESEAAAALIADELSQKGVLVAPISGSVTCQFEKNNLFGTTTMDGETFEVYIGSVTIEPIGIRRDSMTMRAIKPIGYKRKITLIER